MSKKDKIQTALSLQFKCEKEHWSNYSKDQLVEVGRQFNEKLLQDKSYHDLDLLDQVGFFKIFMPELHALKNIPQTKQNSKDAFHHSLTVVQHVMCNPILKWAALLHDIGKAHFRTSANGSFDFRGHEFNGAKLAKGLLRRMDIKGSGDIYKLIQFHTHPLDYQRQPNWKLETVKNFVNKYEHLAQPLIDLAIADKISSSSKSEYLEELYKLKNMVQEIQYPNDQKTIY